MGFAAGFKMGWDAAGDAKNDRVRAILAGVNRDFSPDQTQVDSGEDALAAAQKAKEIALSNATDDTQLQQIEQDYAPTIKALEADKSRPASVVHSIGVGSNFQQRDKAFSPNEVSDARIAARAGIYRDAGMDDEADRLETNAMQRKASQMHINDMQYQEDQRNKLKEVDGALRAWGEQNIKKDANGQPVLNDDTMVNLGKMRVFELGKRGLYDEAMRTAQQSMQYATSKIQAEQVERQAAVRDAVAAAAMGDFTKSLEIYNRFVPDGGKATGVVKNKDGSYTVKRVSAVDGTPIEDGRFQNLDQLVSTINSFSDSNALANYVNRTFQHDIESRRLNYEGQRVNIAQQGETRAQGKDAREEARMNAVSKGLSDYADAEAKGDTAGMHAARRAVLANGGKLDKPETVKPDVKVGQLGDITVSQPTGGGGVQVTNYGPDMKPKGSVSVPAAGAAPAASAPPSGAIAALKADPKRAAEFDAKYGKGASAQYLK